MEFSCYHPKSLVSLLINSKALAWMEDQEQICHFNSGYNSPKKDTRMKLMSSSDHLWDYMNLTITAL